jgi:hypothetical protein
MNQEQEKQILNLLKQNTRNIKTVNRLLKTYYKEDFNLKIYYQADFKKFKKFQK